MRPSICRPTRIILVVAVSILWGMAARSQDLVSRLNLRGKWKFDIGDNMNRAKERFDDSHWSEISVPSPWEDQGFPGYDGFAWYRKHFYAPAAWKGEPLYLQLGKIDDADEVYLNGHFIAYWGQFPPHYISVYGASRRYYLPTEFLHPDSENVIAVRVYDATMQGGIVSGPVGIFVLNDPLIPDLRLEKGWVFRTGDNAGWRDIDLDESEWKPIRVPAFWETQGYPEYNGFGWYRLQFRVPSQLAGSHLVLLLGRIDDVDEAFLNGVRIGGTGEIPLRSNQMGSSTEYLQFRAYDVPSELLKTNGENVLAVRVYDNFLQGGIYDGPIGLVKQDTYRHWKDRQPTGRRWWLWQMLDRIFR